MDRTATGLESKLHKIYLLETAMCPETESQIYFRYTGTNKTNTIVYTIISAIKQVKLKLILAYLAVLLILQLMLSDGSVHHLKNK